MHAAIDFIRKYGRLDEPSRLPDFCAAAIPGWTSPLGHRHPWRDDPLHHQPAVSGADVYRHDFARIGLETVLCADFERSHFSAIPDSEEYMLIDVGSHLGRRVTRPFARSHPHVQVVMVDCLKRDDVIDDFNYQRFNHSHDAPLELKVAITDDIASSVNALLQANGYANVRYVNKQLTPADYDIGIRSLTRSRRVVVTGFRNPKGLGAVTAAIAVREGAEKLYLNQSGIECIPPSSPSFDPLKKYLAPYFAPEEVAKIIALIHDPQHTDTLHAEKYDRTDEGRRLFSAVLRLLFVLPQKKMLEQNGYATTLFQEARLGDVPYNQPAYHLRAYRRK